MAKIKKEKSLTLSQLAEYNNEILLPTLEEHFASKKDVNEIKIGQDEIITKLNTLLQEKDVGDTQDKRKTEVLKIHSQALKRSKILSKEETLHIDGLQAF